MTLISVYNSDGLVGRCDSKCYDAKEPECECICGGRNHGAGQRKVLNNTQELSSQWIENWKSKFPGREWTFEVPGNQLELF